MLLTLLIITQLVTNDQGLIDPGLQEYLEEKLPRKIEYIVSKEKIAEYRELKLEPVEIKLMNSILTRFEFIDGSVLNSSSYFLEEAGNVDYVYEIFIKKYYQDELGSIKRRDRQLRQDFKRIRKKFDKEFDKLENGTEEFPGYILSDYHKYVLKNIPHLQIQINAMTGGCLRTADIVVEYRIRVKSSDKS